MTVRAADREGRRVTLSVRLTPEGRERLERSASVGGRSLAQEIEQRLERSYDRDDLRTVLREELRAELRAELRSEIRAALSSAGDRDLAMLDHLGARPIPVPPSQMPS